MRLLGKIADVHSLNSAFCYDHTSMFLGSLTVPACLCTVSLQVLHPCPFPGHPAPSRAAAGWWGLRERRAQLRLPHSLAVPQHERSGCRLRQPNTISISFHNPHHSCTCSLSVETGVLVIAVWSVWTPPTLTSLMSMLFPLRRIHTFVYLPRSSHFPQNCQLLLLFFPGSHWLLYIAQYFSCPQKSVAFSSEEHWVPITSQEGLGGNSGFPRGYWICRKMCALFF